MRGRAAIDEKSNKPAAGRLTTLNGEAPGTWITLRRASPLVARIRRKRIAALGRITAAAIPIARAGRRRSRRKRTIAKRAARAVCLVWIAADRGTAAK